MLETEQDIEKNCSLIEQRNTPKSVERMQNSPTDEWRAKDRKQLNFLLSHRPPRPYSIFRQIAEDFSAWEIYRFFGLYWAVAIALAVFGKWIAAGVVTAVFVAHYSFLMLNTVRMMRHDRLETGWVAEFQPHVLSNQPVFKDWIAATAMLDSGEKVPVTLTDPQCRELLGKDEGLEVLVLISSTPLKAKNASHMVVAYRPTSRDCFSPILSAQ